MTKLSLSRKIQPKTLFLGSSRTEYLAPEQVFPPAERKRIFNFALSGGTVHEMRDLLKWSIERYPIKRVFYGIDLITLTNRSSNYRKGFDKKLVNGKQPLWAGEARFFLTWTALKESRNCIQINEKDPEGVNVRYQYNFNGSRTNRWRQLQLKKQGKKWLSERFSRAHEQYQRHYNRNDLVLSQEKLEAYEDILEICNKEGIEFRAFVPPIHISQYRLILISPAYEIYKEFLLFLGKNLNPEGPPLS